jgi:hypothetical protein
MIMLEGGCDTFESMKKPLKQRQGRKRSRKVGVKFRSMYLLHLSEGCEEKMPLRAKNPGPKVFLDFFSYEED